MAASARTRLQNSLLRIGGVDVDFIDDPYHQMIAEAGGPFDNAEVLIARGRPNECHRNAAMFWLKGMCTGIAVGYYLGLDDVWRQHSWGLMDDGKILDTHLACQLYFGVPVEPMDAIKFAEDHLGVAVVLRFLKRNPERFQPIIDDALKALTSPF